MCAPGARKCLASQACMETSLSCRLATDLHQTTAGISALAVLDIYKAGPCYQLMGKGEITVWFIGLHPL